MLTAIRTGSSDYSSEIGQLANPQNDVALLAQALKGRGFEVTVARDTNLRAGTCRRAADRYGLTAVDRNNSLSDFSAGQSAISLIFALFLPLGVQGRSSAMPRSMKFPCPCSGTSSIRLRMPGRRNSLQRFALVAIG
jgi:hypothetical protein